MTCWKDPQEWPTGGSDEDRDILAHVLEIGFVALLRGGMFWLGILAQRVNSLWLKVMLC